MPKRITLSVDQVREMHQSGMTYAQIGQRLGVSRNTVSNYLNPAHYENQLAKVRAKAAAEREGKEVQKRAKDVPSDKPFRIEDYIWPQNNITVVMPKDTRDNTGKLMGDPVRGPRFVVVKS
jgi:DNA-binding transcriptional regulator LsrR (DeoR family)